MLPVGKGEIPSPDSPQPQQRLLLTRAELSNHLHPVRVRIFGRQVSQPFFHVKLAEPLDIDVEQIAQELGYRYRGPIQSQHHFPPTEAVLNDANPDQQQVLRLSEHDGTGFTALESILSPSDFFTEILTLSDDLKDPIIDALRDAGMDIPEISPQRIADVIAAKERAQRAQEMVLFMEILASRPVGFCREAAVF